MIINFAELFSRPRDLLKFLLDNPAASLAKQAWICNQTQTDLIPISFTLIWRLCSIAITSDFIFSFF